MVVTLPVARKTDYGYFLSAGETDLLLHRNEATRELEAGEEVQVFLYHDSEERLAATMQMPHVREGEYGWLEVVGSRPNLGVFLDNGIQKDLLLFVDDLPKLADEWPQMGDHVLVTLKRDKQGRLLAKPASETEILRISKPAEPDLLNQWVEGTVYKVIATGAFLLTDEDYILFVHRDEMAGRLRLGQTVRCRVTYVREDGRLNGSMHARKEQKYQDDAERLLQYLRERNGAMPYTDDTPADIIKEKFGISKSAFKRAMGKLLKERKVVQEDGWTHLQRELLDQYQRELEQQH